MKRQSRLVAGLAFSICSALALSKVPLNELPNLQSNQHTSDLLTQDLMNTKFLENTPDYDDLYLILTPDKVRTISVYCNPGYCYVLRNHKLAT